MKEIVGGFFFIIIEIHDPKSCI